LRICFHDVEPQSRFQAIEEGLSAILQTNVFTDLIVCSSLTCEFEVFAQLHETKVIIHHRFGGKLSDVEKALSRVNRRAVDNGKSSSKGGDEVGVSEGSTQGFVGLKNQLGCTVERGGSQDQFFARIIGQSQQIGNMIHIRIEFVDRIIAIRSACVHTDLLLDIFEG
jgi:hypothetical protein